MVAHYEIDDQRVQEEASRTALIILAAGLSQRFGSSDKLSADLAGLPLALHILQSCVDFNWAQRILVCAKHAEWHKDYLDAGFTLVENPHPENGLGTSLKLGSKAVRRAAKVMICLADMPLIDRLHIARVLYAHNIDTGDVTATRSSGYCGPPAILPLESIANLPANQTAGARDLLRDGFFVETELALTHDVDRPADLVLAAELIGVRSQ